MLKNLILNIFLISFLFAKIEVSTVVDSKEIYNYENEVSFFEKGKYEMCDLISNIDLVYSGIFKDRVVK